MERSGVRATATSRRAALHAAASAGAVALAGCSMLGGDDPSIEAATEPLLDETLDLRATGFDAGAQVTLHAGMRLPGAPCEARATFEADGDGVVDVGEVAPVEGTYDGADPMGLVWSQRRQQRLDDPKLELEAGVNDPEEQIVPLRVAAFVDGERVAGADIDRRVSVPGVTRERPASTDLAGVAAYPPGDGPHPGVLVFHGGGGNTRMTGRVAGQLAAHGIAAFAVQYFGDPPAVPDRQVGVPLEYFDRAIEWFTGRDGVAGDRVGAVGWSLGGILAQLLGARRDDVGAVVGYSTQPYVVQFSSFPDGTWTVDGETVPYVEAPIEESDRRDGKRRTRPAIEAGFERADEETIDAARIPVEEVDGPVLYVAGEDDATVPAAPYCRRATEWLDAGSHDHDYDLLAYEGAGHVINTPYLPTTGRAVIGDRIHGGTPAGIAAAETDSWPTVIEYLKKGLGQG